MSKKNWVVEFENAGVEKSYRKLFESGELSKDDNKIILKWIEIIETRGPDVLFESSFWHDHALFDNWTGHRSSSFSKVGRIIYKIVDRKLIVSVVKITTDHNYKR